MVGPVHTVHSTKNTEKVKKGGMKKGSGGRAAQKPSNAPRATEEQVGLARLISIPIEDAERKAKLQQIQECIACDLEKAVAALHDADGDVQTAIEILLDNYEDDWHDTISRKSKNRKRVDQDPIEPTKTDSNLSLNSKTGSTGEKKQKPNKGNKGKKNKPVSGQTSRKESLSSESAKKVLQTKPATEGLVMDCGEWQGESIEVVNSCVEVPKNIHEDPELMKLLMAEPEEVDSKEQEEEEEEVKVEEESAEAEPQPEAEVEEVKKPIDSVEAAKREFFGKYAHSQTPPPSSVPDVPIFIAPCALINGGSIDLNDPKLQLDYMNFCRSGSVGFHISKSVDPAVAEGLLGQKSVPVESQGKLKTPSQCDFPNVMSTLLPPVQNLTPSLQANQTFSTSIQTESAHKETFTKMQDHAAPQGRPPSQSVNNFDNTKGYGYNLLGELSQNMKQASLEMQVGKADAFTQSISASQTEGSAAVPYPMQPTKQVVCQPPPMNKPISSLSQNTSQTMPNSQTAMHPVIHPGIPPILSHIQQNLPYFNFTGNSAAAGVPPLDIDQFQALQQHQQRMLYEMQSQHIHPSTQMATTENPMPAAPADVIASTKSNVPVHQVTTANVNSGITLLPYTSGMFLMNGFPNAYLGQQQQQQQPQASQVSVTQSQSPGHGGSPLSHPANAQQFNKPMNSAPHYAGYQGLRQSNFEEVGDNFYNLAKQMNYKHNAGVQGFYGPSKPGVGPDLSLGNKLQQQGPVMPSAQQATPTQASQPPNTAPTVQQQQQALYTQQAAGQYPYYNPHCLAAAAAAAVAAQSQPNQVTSSSGNQAAAGNMVPMHSRPAQ